MRIFYRIAAYILLPIAGVVLVAGITGTVLYLSADTTPPQLRHDGSQEKVVRLGHNCSAFGESRMRRSDNGFWEVLLCGDAEQRGTAFGALTDSLMAVQEAAFVGQIREMIPDDGYLRFLRYLTVAYNRNIAHHIPEEYLREIAAMSEFCSPEYDFIGTPYMRQLNYHAAHDIGHALQEYMLVGCSAFGAWGSASQQGLIVGRNFDFHVGDAFARNRVLTFCRPDTGYGFVSIGWAGMVGVLSGMNEKGLTVTLNAAKGTVPYSSATPVSILAREILQHAASIDEAYDIASDFRLFVSESFLIGSVVDGRCAVIEKTPQKQALYTSSGQTIALTNHFQSKELYDEADNLRNIALSDSRPRLNRLREVVAQARPLSVERAVGVLRDHKAVGGRELGWGNPMAINQNIAHHSVVFLPEELKMWVSTAHCGMGEWVCYNVGDILQGHCDFTRELYDNAHRLPADSAFLNDGLDRLRAYRRIVREPRNENVDSLVELNPCNWEAYRQAAAFYRTEGQRRRADSLLRMALQLPMPEGERIKLKQALTK